MHRTASRFQTLTNAAILALALVSATACAQTKPRLSSADPAQPKTIMYVGNSFFYYNNSMHTQVSAIATAADPQNRAAYRSTSITMGGSGLNWHDVDSYFKPGGVASYSFVGDNEIRFNKFDKPFDVVIMMDCSQCPIHPQLGPMFHDYAKRHSDTVRKHKAQPMLFMSWAYEDKPEMTAQLAEQYTIAGNANNALVIPAGLAFARAIAKQPDINAIPLLVEPTSQQPPPTRRFTANRQWAARILRPSMPQPPNSYRRSPGKPCKPITQSNRHYCR
jgi:hypothetical protein